jgi:hypothetical protein
MTVGHPLGAIRTDSPCLTATERMFTVCTQLVKLRSGCCGARRKESVQRLALPRADKVEITVDGSAVCTEQRRTGNKQRVYSLSEKV